MNRPLYNIYGWIQLCRSLAVRLRFQRANQNIADKQHVNDMIREATPENYDVGK
jgi:hypothetical protein